MKPAALTLIDGSSFRGRAPDWFSDSVLGEVVFNTGMVGYPESLSDPSYAGQILVFTYPMIGNYAVPSADMLESDCIQPSGVVISTLSDHWQHSRGLVSLPQWLDEHRIPYLVDVDTRNITQKIRSFGAMQGALALDRHLFLPSESRTPSIMAVTCSDPLYYGSGSKTIVVVDCGVKKSILRQIVALGVQVKVVPADYDYSHEPYDGIVISNGPGDPAEARETIAILARALKRGKPVFGICLGAQLLALAAGAKTYKLPFGHRGQNQPCLEVATGRGVITSQNHGYAIDENTLPNEWNVTYRNLNDGSVEGISHDTLPFFGVQFHPEACPGPVDSRDFFLNFLTGV